MDSKCNAAVPAPIVSGYATERPQKNQNTYKWPVLLKR
jgi:hypothetical protein